MSYVTYDSIRPFLSNQDEQSLNTGVYNVLYATNFAASNTTALTRVRRIGQELDYYIQTGPKTASVSMTVIPVTGSSVNQLTGFLALTGNSTSGCYIQVPDYRFDKCFLKSLSVSFEPWKVATANLQFDSYGLATGSGINVYASQEAQTGVISPLRGMSIAFTTTNFTQTISEYESLNFSVEVERRPNFEIGNAYPTQTSVAKITKYLQIEGISNMDWLSDYQPNTSGNLTVTMADGNTISLAGVLSEQNVSIDANGVAKGGLRIVEEMV